MRGKIKLKGIDDLKKELEKLSSLKEIPFQCPKCGCSFNAKIGENVCPSCGTVVERTE